MALRSLLRDFAAKTREMTEGFDRVFGRPRRASRASKDRAGRKVAKLSPRRGRRRPIFMENQPRRERRNLAPRRSTKKLFDRDKKRRLV